jgi:hypothetical protein
VFGEIGEGEDVAGDALHWHDKQLLACYALALGCDLEEEKERKRKIEMNVRNDERMLTEERR